METALIIYLLIMASILFYYTLKARDMWGVVGSLWLTVTVLLPALYLLFV